MTLLSPTRPHKVEDALQGRSGQRIAWEVTLTPGVPLKSGGDGRGALKTRGGPDKGASRGSEHLLAVRCCLEGTGSRRLPGFHFRTGLPLGHGVQGVCVPMPQDLPEPEYHRSVSGAVCGWLQLPW